MLTPAPGSSFEVLSPKMGVSELPDYTFHTKTMHHYFCPHCGVHCFLIVKAPTGGNEVQEVFVNAGTLDSKADGSTMIDLSKLKSKYLNGKAEAWSDPLADTPYEGGLS